MKFINIYFINGTACTGKPTMLTNSKTNINKSYLYRGTFY